MASEVPTLDSLKSWRDAFNYPLPVTRQIERGLRTEILSNKDRLRTLVGASYRDLLSTAETIGHLDGRMQETEASLADLSRNCNSDVIDRKAESVARLRNEEDRKLFSKRARAAHLFFLQKCRLCTSRLLKQRGSILLCAKLLAVSRLLHKTLSQRSEQSALLETLRSQLASLRRHLSHRIDHLLTSPKSTLEDLVEAICAFCLATNSSSSDALQHYYSLRLQGIRLQTELQAKGQDQITQAFQYYLSSLQTTRRLLGRALSEGLRSLRSQPILQDPAILQIDDLELSTFQRWVATEIQDFVPFIKHNDLTNVEIQSATSGWSKRGFSEFIEIFKEKIQLFHKVSEVTRLRKALFEIWLPVCTSVPSHSLSELLEGLRSVINHRIQTIIHLETNALTNIGSAISNTVISHETMGRPSLSIWDEAFVTMPLSNGASSFKQQVKARHFGISDDISDLTRPLGSWIQSINTTKSDIESVRKDRWQDIIEEDEADEEAPIKIEAILHVDDPNLFARIQETSLQQSIGALQDSIQVSADQITAEHGSKQIRFLLRTIREVQQRLHTAFPGFDLSKLETVVPKLHQRLALDLSRQVQVATLFGTNKAKARSSKLVAVWHLWEGDPALPLQPSKHVFRFLHKLSSVMMDLGPDLWTPAAVRAVKDAYTPEVIQALLLLVPRGGGTGKSESQSKAAGGLTNGEPVLNGPQQASEVEHKLAVQALFDMLLLRSVLLPPSASGGSKAKEFGEPVKRLENLSGLDSRAMKLLEKRANEYWARTSLLFGLLST